MYPILARNDQNRFGFWGSAQDPAEGSLRRSPDPLVARSFVPSAIAASRSQFYLLARSW